VNKKKIKPFITIKNIIMRNACVPETPACGPALGNEEQ